MQNEAVTVQTPPGKAPPSSRLARSLAVFGPGLVVMLADTDVGSVITAGQSGVQYGYRLLLQQIILVPILYMVQELTVRLGIFHGPRARRADPRHVWTILGLGVGRGVGGGDGRRVADGVFRRGGDRRTVRVPRAYSLSLAVVALLAVVLTGGYRRVERAAIAVGLFEFAFFYVAWAAHPSVRAVAEGAVSIPWRDPGYLYLSAANIGAVIMPWMVFYQQSAIADKKLRPEHYGAARLDTAVGALVTQLVMAAVLIACAATIGAKDLHATLTTVGEMSQALTPFMGERAGRLVFSLGVLGAGLVASIVASLALAWGVGEVAGYKRSLELRPLQARWFYGVYAICVVAGAVLVGVWPNLVSLNVGVQVMNALLLPLVLGFLIALAVFALPAERRLRGWYMWVVIVVAALTTALGVYGGFSGAGLV